MTFVKRDARTNIAFRYMMILFHTIKMLNLVFKTIYMLKINPVYDENVKSESRKATTLINV